MGAESTYDTCTEHCNCCCETHPQENLHNVLLLLRHIHDAQHAAMTTPCASTLAHLKPAYKHCTLCKHFEICPVTCGRKAAANSSTAQLSNLHLVSQHACMHAGSICRCLAIKHTCVVSTDNLCCLDVHSPQPKSP